MIDDDIKIKPGRGKTAPKIKPEQPQQYQVVLNQTGSGSGRPYISCAGCVLVDVFRKSFEDAVKHAQNVAKQGKEPVYTSTREVTEEKAAQANEAKGGRGFLCGFKLRKIMFTSEPAP